MAAEAGAEGAALFWIDWIGGGEKIAMRLCLRCNFNFVVVVLLDKVSLCNPGWP